MALSKRRRYEILRRDGFACRYCGRRAPDVVLEVDHVTPRALGGTDHPSNLAAACQDCNRGKSSTPLSAVTLAAQDEELIQDEITETYAYGHDQGRWEAWYVARYLAAIGAELPEEYREIDLGTRVAADNWRHRLGHPDCPGILDCERAVNW